MKFISLLAFKTEFETSIIKTCNSGERTKSLKLAELLPYASGYAVEPQEIVSVFERFCGILPSDFPDVMKYGVDLFRIETRNPESMESHKGVHFALYG